MRVHFAIARFVALRLTALAAVGLSSLSHAEGWDYELAAEQRHFFQDSLFDRQNNNVSFRGRAAYIHGWNNDQDSFEFTARARWDERDHERTNADIQDFAWFHVEENWELRTGLRKIFWGVTESRHLVDIINQSDVAEGIDGEDKLGQPMINISWAREWGSFDIFVLPGFRERTFPSTAGRPGAVVELDLDHARYESGAKSQRVDMAARVKFSIEAWEIAISEFYGTSRDPVFEETLTKNVFAPFYPVIEQTGLEVQYNVSDWIFKMESITRNGNEGGRYSANTSGFEYTQVGLLDSPVDLGWVLEYSFDDRGTDGPDPNEHDWMLATRWTFNDAANSSILAGVSYDPVNFERLISLEVKTRITDDWGLDIDGFFFHGDSPPRGEILPYGTEKKLWPFYRDDLLQVELVRYF